jgi:eukaryotic-like serine/threonine-protein kinase
MIAPASRRIGKYEILQKLGRGGMADVYLARDNTTGAMVALKLIEHGTDVDTLDSIEAERRGTELQTRLAAVDPHVAEIYDSSDADGFFYVAMEYVEGQDLAELMQPGPLEPKFAVELALAVAETLDKAHNLEVVIGERTYQGIVHGDIKPKNIRIDASGRVRVLDFGIAKALSLSRKLTRNEFGSVPYASPERLDAGEVSVQTDLWSLAVMLYEMVTGLRPYHAATTERLEAMVRSRIPPPPPPDPCPEALRRILIKALAPVVTARYGSAREMAADFAAFQAGGTVQAAQEDLDATRRTFRWEDEETRRTDRSAEAQGGETRQMLPSVAAPTPSTHKPRLRMFSTAPWLARVLGWAVVAWIAWTALTSYVLYQHGKRLERDIQTEQVKDLDDIWKRWTELSDGNPSSFLLRGPRRLVRQKFVAEADHVIDSYRNNNTVRENGWKDAHDLLAKALAVDPGDSIRGKLRLCEGHLARIKGIARRSAPELNRAVDLFNEAQQLMPKSPDPELGLALVFVYGLGDIDKADEALQQAAKRGYALGNREKAQLADGYRARAERMFSDARKVRGLPQEKDQIQRSREDYEHALELYQSIAPYGNSLTMIARVETSMDGVDLRLREIDNGTGNSPVDILRHLLRPWQ